MFKKEVFQSNLLHLLHILLSHPEDPSKVQRGYTGGYTQGLKRNKK